MGRKRTRAKLVTCRILDATPERLSKGDESEWINPATIDSSEQRIGLVRRFRTTHLDRLFRGKRLSWAQYYAGDWYRNQHAKCSFALSVVASYGERSGASEPSYGLPRSMSQANARKLFRVARDQFAQVDLSFMDRLLLDDELPTYGGRVPLRNVRRIQAALDGLADWLMLPVDNADVSTHQSVIVQKCALRSAA